MREAPHRESSPSLRPNPPHTNHPHKTNPPTKQGDDHPCATMREAPHRGERHPAPQPHTGANAGRAGHHTPEHQTHTPEHHEHHEHHAPTRTPPHQRDHANQRPHTKLAGPHTHHHSSPPVSPRSRSRPQRPIRQPNPAPPHPVLGAPSVVSSVRVGLWWVGCSRCGVSGGFVAGVWRGVGFVVARGWRRGGVGACWVPRVVLHCACGSCIV